LKGAGIGNAQHKLCDSFGSSRFTHEPEGVFRHGHDTTARFTSRPCPEGRDSRLFFHFEGRESTLDPPNEEKGRRVKILGLEFGCSWRYEMSNSCSQLSTQGSREGARQRRERRGASTVGLGSWSAFSRPSALIWYHERRAVAHVSQDPSPRPHSVSFLHSRPSPCCEFLKKVNSRPSEIEKQPRVSTLHPRVGR